MTSHRMMQHPSLFPLFPCVGAGLGALTAAAAAAAVAVAAAASVVTVGEVGVGDGGMFASGSEFALIMFGWLEGLSTALWGGGGGGGGGGEKGFIVTCLLFL